MHDDVCIDFMSVQIFHAPFLFLLHKPKFKSNHEIQ